MLTVVADQEKEIVISGDLNYGLKQSNKPASTKRFINMTKYGVTYGVTYRSKFSQYGVTYRSKFSLGIFPIEKLIFVSEIN